MKGIHINILFWVLSSFYYSCDALHAVCKDKWTDICSWFLLMLSLYRKNILGEMVLAYIVSLLTFA